MPVNLLLVEGKLEVEIFTALFAGHPPVRAEGSKDSLRLKVQRLRGMPVDGRPDPGRVLAGYPRDRDFDFEPSAAGTGPTPEPLDQGEVIGWRWQRHAIENYLLDPALVVPATGWPRQAYEEQLTVAASRLRHYQTARWVIGTGRRGWPRHYQLNTSPTDLGSGVLVLPEDLGETAIRAWLHTHLGTWRNQLVTLFGPPAIDARYAQHAQHLSDAVLADVSTVLTWCSGKNLLAAMEPWLRQQRWPGGAPITNAGAFRAGIRSWIRQNAELTLATLSEWQALLSLIRR